MTWRHVTHEYEHSGKSGGDNCTYQQHGLPEVVTRLYVKNTRHES